MPLSAIFAISLGAVAGALLRAGLAQACNALFPDLPPGTLLANLLGAYLIGLAMAVFAALPQLAPEWRWLVMTGFLGSLTTFSTFSAEVFALLQQGRPAMAALAVAAHLGGSLLMILLGLASAGAFRRWC
ncbi:MAG: fluoride efflux transporter CrcB [Rhodocyclaceae bacterium]|nr:fluoride efflux transporter CrcB [Rhodocyclaceae bacterium]